MCWFCIDLHLGNFFFRPSLPQASILRFVRARPMLITHPILLLYLTAVGMHGARTPTYVLSLNSSTISFTSHPIYK
ncbi:hypothetical protein BDV18DRAFT_135104 [Aspergillus unguis]